MKYKPAFSIFLALLFPAVLFGQTDESEKISRFLSDIFFEREWSLNCVNFPLIDQGEEIFVEEAEDSYKKLENKYDRLFAGLSGEEIPHITVNKLYDIDEAGLLIIEGEFDRNTLIDAFKKTGGVLQPHAEFKYYSRNGDICFSIHENFIVISEYKDNVTGFTESAFYSQNKVSLKRTLLAGDKLSPDWILLTIASDYFAENYFRAMITKNSESYTMTYSSVYADTENYEQQKANYSERKELMKKQMIPRYADDFTLEAIDEFLFLEYKITGIKSLSDLLKLEL